MLLSDELISVVIPARNAGRFIQRTLNSVLNQSYRHLEVVIVDDGSIDDTAIIVQQAANFDARVRLFRSHYVGASAARNLAITKARGSLIAPVDADDIWHTTKLARQLEVMKAGSAELGVVYCWSRGIDDNDRVILPSWNDSTAVGNVLHAIIVRGIAGNGSTPLIKRKFIDNVGGYDPTTILSEDWKLYTALAGVCEFDVVPQYLVGYRLHDHSASKTEAQRMEKAVSECTAWIRSNWPCVPADIMLDRDNVIGMYLAFIAIRNCEYAAALRYVASAVKARPLTFFSVNLLRLLVLVPLHAAGFRHYSWRFWKKPLFTEMTVS